MLEQLAPYDQAAVISRARILLERFPGVNGASNLIRAWLTVEPMGESILDSTDRGAALSFLDQAWAARYLQDAGQQAAATELAEHVLRSLHCQRDQYETAASVLLKADRAAAVSQLLRCAPPDPPSAWLAGVIDALRQDFSPEVERFTLFCAQTLLARPRITSSELFSALAVPLIVEGRSGAQSAAEAARTRPELSPGQRREIACGLASLAQLDLAQSVWAHLLERQDHPITDGCGSSAVM
jgi:hypothetical protein